MRYIQILRGLSAVALFGVALLAGPARADAPLIDRQAVFARAQAIALARLPELAAERLLPFAIDYRLTLLETGRPEGAFEVDLLIAGSRALIAAPDLVAAAADAEEVARFEKLLAGAATAYFYEIVKLRFAETGERPDEASRSTILLNRDPESPPAEKP
jgi:hypothetical protein